MCVKNEKQLNNEKLEELFELYEEQIYENTETNRKLSRKIVKAEEQFYEKLTEEQIKDFEQLYELKQLNYDETDKNIFIFAFKLATNIILEAIC